MPSSSVRFARRSPSRPSRTTCSSTHVVLDQRRLVHLRAGEARQPGALALHERQRLVALDGTAAPARRARAPRSLPKPTCTLRKRARRGAVRDVRVLARLALAAVRQPVQAPTRRSRPTRVERAPEDRRLPGVGRVAQHPAELAVLDLPGDLRAELEVEALVVDRPALVRLQEDARRPRRRSARRASPRPARGGGSSCARAACGSSCPRASSRPARCRSCAAVSREVRKPLRTPSSTIGSPPGGDALVVEAEGAEAAGRGRVGGDVHVLGAVAQRAEVARLEEARAGVGGLGPVDAVELGRVADRLVHLQRHLLGVDHDRRHSRRAWARRGGAAAACSPTRGASRSRPSDSTYSQPACELEPPCALG